MSNELATVLSELEPVLKEFEGNVLHLYLDKRGYVTAGVGHLVVNLEAAYALPLCYANGLPADQVDIYDDYQAIKKSIPGRLPAYYAQIADLRMSQAAVDNLLYQDMRMISQNLTRCMLLVKLAACPPPAQCALVSMAYQLGAEGVAHGYPELMKACAASDWKKAAEECFIHDAQPARNEANKKFFLAA